MIEQQDVTIIIPHLFGSEASTYSLDECINSLVETCKCNIVICWNSLGEEVEIHPLFTEGNQIVNIFIQQQGQCKAVNAAAAIVDTPYILVTNDDMIYYQGWFEDLVSGINEADTICISPKLIEPTQGAPTFDTFFCGGAGGDFDLVKWRQYAKDYRGKGDWEIRTGFNLPFLISKELWDLVGGYDINYDPWGSNSDSDLEYKIKLAGIQPLQNPNCIVYHFSQTSGTFEPRNRAAWEINWQYFIDKWGFPRTDNGIWEASFTIPTEDQGRSFNPWWEGFFD